MDAINKMGRMYENGDGVERDSARACRLFKRAADGGNLDATNNLGRMYENGRGVAQSSVKACELFRLASDGGHIDATNNLARSYADGNGVAKDSAVARGLYQRAADAGHVTAAYSLGLMYENGDGVAEDTAKACQLYQRAVDCGNMDAINKLGRMYESGNGVAEDGAKACDLYQLAADCGHMDAANNLGRMYQMGKGRVKDCTKAYQLFLRATNGGHMHAAYNLVQIAYENDSDVTKDNAKAMQSCQRVGDGVRKFITKVSPRSESTKRFSTPERLEASGSNMDMVAAEPHSTSERSKALRENLQFSQPSRPEVVLGKSGNPRIECIEVLPDGDSVATFSADGMLRAWSTLNGELLWEVKAHEGEIGRRALAVLGRTVVATGGYDDSSVRTWNARSGDARDTLNVCRGGVSVIARLGSRQFLLGCGSGKILICQHEDGRLLTTVFKLGSISAHTGMITDLSVSGGRFASSSIDKTARVWDTETGYELATLNGHSDPVLCCDMSDNVIVTGSSGTPFVRVYSIAGGYSCINTFGALSWVHQDAVTALRVLDRDHVLSTSSEAVCVTELQTDLVLARLHISSEVLSCSVLPSGDVAVAVDDGSGTAKILPVPQEAYDSLTKFGSGRNRDVVAAGELALMAAGMCETVRTESDAALQVGKVLSDATNYDTCFTFLRHCRQWKENAEKNGRVSIAFHGTPSDNVASIVENGFRVPDGVQVVPIHGHSLGKGIYVSAKPELAFRYSRGTPIFGCLITTGDLKPGMYGRTPEEEGCDSFRGARGGKEVYVLQSSSQILPCMTADWDSVEEATHLLEKLVIFIEQNI